MQVTAYNRTAKRHGQRIKEAAVNAGVPYTFNMPMWYRISKHEENYKMFRLDGLHLSNAGSVAIAKCWIKQIGMQYDDPEDDDSTYVTDAASCNPVFEP